MYSGVLVAIGVVPGILARCYTGGDCIQRWHMEYLEYCSALLFAGRVESKCVNTACAEQA